MYDFAAEVPDDPLVNLEYRLYLRKEANKSRALQRALVQACAEDELFFLSAWCCLHEPRDDGSDGPKVIPFIPWVHQVPPIRVMAEYLGKRDFGIEKARAEGASWIVLMLFLHRWLFRNSESFGLVSKDERSVDTPGKLGTLLPKVEWQLEWLPNWMKPVRKGRDYERRVTDHTLINYRNGSIISGFSATGDVGSGDRFTAVLFDELAKFKENEDQHAMNSLHHTTNCRILVSTPKGNRGVYYTVMNEHKFPDKIAGVPGSPGESGVYTDPESNMLKIVLDWKDNPSKNQGLYSCEGGQIRIIDQKYQFPPKYPFVVTPDKGGEIRSPWYDEECKRPGATKRSIAQELDRDYGGSDYQFFDAQMIKRITLEAAAPPRAYGRLRYNLEAMDRNLSDYMPKFLVRHEDHLEVWCFIDGTGRPPRDTDYVIGCDISQGTGGDWSSNSVAQVISVRDRVQVAEFASRHVRPTQFAQIAIALCCWFRGPSGRPALLNWETNGPGETFSNEVRRIGFRNVWYREREDVNRREKMENPGWRTTKNNKQKLFDELARALDSGDLIVRSKKLLTECGQYVFINGKIEHGKATSTEDESGKGISHGDRVMALGVAWWTLKDKPVERLTSGKQPQKVPYGSMAWRQQQLKLRQELQEERWE